MGKAYRRTGLRITEGDFFWPLAIIFGLSILSMTLGAHFSVLAYNRASETREQTLAENGIAQSLEGVAHMIVPQTDWDDATRNLDNHYDPAWAETNIGKFLSQADGFDKSFVLDANDHPLFAARGSAAGPVAQWQPIAPLAASLVRSVRVLEAKRGPILHAPSSEMVSRPIQASTLKIVDGKLAILTATLVQPDFGTALPHGPRAPIVVTAMDVDRGFLASFGRRYLMEGLHVRAIDQKSIPGEIDIPATDGQGRLLAHFAWRPLDPGYSMLRSLALPSLLICCALGLVVFFQLRRIHRSAAELIRREARGSSIAYADPFTALPSATFFQDELSRQIAMLEPEGKGLTVLVVRLDAPQRVRDKLGPDAGDTALRSASWRLSAACPDDVLLARLGEADFGVLLPESSKLNITTLTERLHHAMRTPLVIDDWQISSTCWIGTVIVTKPDTDATAVIRDAEIALYVAKQCDSNEGAIQAA